MHELINYYDYNGYTVIDILSEELSLHQVSRIAKSNNLELERLNFPNVIIDITKLNYIDTSGLGFIANMKRFLSKYGNDVAVICINDYILHLMHLTKIETLVKIVSSLDEAVEYLNNRKKTIPLNEVNISKTF